MGGMPRETEDPRREDSQDEYAEAEVPDIESSGDQEVPDVDNLGIIGAACNDRGQNSSEPASFSLETPDMDIGSSQGSSQCTGTSNDRQSASSSLETPSDMDIASSQGSSQCIDDADVGLPPNAGIANPHLDNADMERLYIIAGRQLARMGDEFDRMIDLQHLRNLNGINLNELNRR